MIGPIHAPLQHAPASHFLYFAYGSNMLTERLVARCPGATPIGVASLTNHRVQFCLKSPDGSGKAGLLSAPGKFAFGIAFRIPLPEQEILDAFEGAPDLYAREIVELTIQEVGQQSAVTYRPRPEHIHDDLLPFDWYHALCSGGARQHGMPVEATAWLETRTIVTNGSNVGAMRGYEQAIAALRAAGIVAGIEGLAT